MCHSVFLKVAGALTFLKKKKSEQIQVNMTIIGFGGCNNVESPGTLNTAERTANSFFFCLMFLF